MFTAAILSNCQHDNVKLLLEKMLNQIICTLFSFMQRIYYFFVFS